MDPRMLDYYNRELAYVREQGAEFAAQFPKVAARLGMHGMDVADPYVERLLEGFAFMSARIQLKMDSEFPRFSQRLLELVYPGYLAPTPSMGVVRFEPSRAEGGSVDGYTIPRLSRMRARLAPQEQTACEFRTGHDVTLWPIRLREARLTAAPPDLPMTGYRWRSAVRGALRLVFETTAQARVDALKLDSLPVFMRGPTDVVSKLQELLHTSCVGILVHAGSLPTRGLAPLPPTALAAEGYAVDQALLPQDLRAFEGYRLLHEYFAFPERYRFFSINGLQKALPGIEGDQFEVVILLKQESAALESVVDAENFALFCSPVVNLFERRSDRIPITSTRFEYHAVIDRARPLDFEIHSVRGVTGHVSDSDREINFTPFYALADTTRHGGGSYFSVRREPRLLSDRARRNGARSGYIGSECFVSLVDAAEAPFSLDLRQVTIDALCTNRDLPLLTPVGTEGSDLALLSAAPVDSISFVAGPTRPTPALAEREITWRLISHLSLNYLTLTDLNPAEGAAALRELLGLYARLAASGADAQIAGVQKINATPVNRRVPNPGPIAFGRGVALALEVDEIPFAGSSPWLLASVLEQFFARHVAINSFTELSLQSLQRGAIAAWPPRIGKRPSA
ncbi:MAG: type VI secretion system baseplate subunit TssF [Burkholderiales bacterium]|nr:type VI secretion system baseplate subunit TssF [Burkholderiales bacterium]